MYGLVLASRAGYSFQIRSTVPPGLEAKAFLLEGGAGSRGGRLAIIHHQWSPASCSPPCPRRGPSSPGDGGLHHTLGLPDSAPTGQSASRKVGVEKPFTYVKAGFLARRSFTDSDKPQPPALAWVPPRFRNPKAQGSTSAYSPVPPTFIKHPHLLRAQKKASFTSYFLSKPPPLPLCPPPCPPFFLAQPRWLSVAVSKRPPESICTTETEQSPSTAGPVAEHDAGAPCLVIIPSMPGGRVAARRRKRHFSAATIRGLDRYAAALKLRHHGYGRRPLRRLIEMKRTLPRRPVHRRHRASPALRPVRSRPSGRPHPQTCRRQLLRAEHQERRRCMTSCARSDRPVAPCTAWPRRWTPRSNAPSAKRSGHPTAVPAAVGREAGRVPPANAAWRMVWDRRVCHGGGHSTACRSIDSLGVSRAQIQTLAGLDFLRPNRQHSDHRQTRHR